MSAWLHPDLNQRPTGDDFFLVCIHYILLFIYKLHGFKVDGRLARYFKCKTGFVHPSARGLWTNRPFSSTAATVIMQRYFMRPCQTKHDTHAHIKGECQHARAIKPLRAALGYVFHRRTEKGTAAASSLLKFVFFYFSGTGHVCEVQSLDAWISQRTAGVMGK